MVFKKISGFFFKHVMDLIRERVEFGKAKYGHGVRVTDDTTTWGTVSYTHLTLPTIYSV